MKSGNIPRYQEMTNKFKVKLIFEFEDQQICHVNWIAKEEGHFGQKSAITLKNEKFRN